MHFFLIDDLKGQTTCLDRESSHHAIRVLRLRHGQRIHITNGLGLMAEAEITGSDPDRCGIQIIRLQHQYNKRPYHLHVAIAPTKSADRFEWFLEKATEIGIDAVTPILCDRSERKSVRHDRSIKIIQTAMLQAGHAFQPVLNAMIPLREFLSERNHIPMYMAHCKSEQTNHLVHMIRPGEDGIVLIGPEGDFSDLEIDFARKQGARDTSLGISRLRTETAGLVACHTYGIMNQSRFREKLT